MLIEDQKIATKMFLPFFKMQALGNDFVIINKAFPSAAQIRAWADRRYGIGFDQLLIVMPSQRANISLRIYNADGSEAKACGNGTRCVAWLWMQQNHTNKVMIEIGPDLFTASRKPGGSIIHLQMGQAIITPLSIDLGDAYLCAFEVTLGNRHVVAFLKEGEPFNSQKEGARISVLPEFQGEVNVEFVHFNTQKRLNIEIYERGVGITPSCGTGACASASAAVAKGLFPAGQKIPVIQKNGALYVTVDENIILTGEVSFVFKGEVRYSSL